ncbi:hypothetical protein NX794_21100 [Streptomyces sp. LP11]|uniref:DNA mismatch repair proteins mutS family domain-containing protein n=1 Tax=Streptomyces pyxinicus TaxID=2970331 RepID=A0ABT2B6X5_9ACTN|nr:hypothetical protein [Streptomyces sp. LP11]MCS0603693.1 hypothetical protein [Streptomyces sp. LP11]
MPFPSVLFADPAQRDAVAAQREPACYTDLNLDQIVSSLTAGRRSYQLEPFFYARLTDADAIAYRHEVFRDLEDQALSEGVARFAAGMREMRRRRDQAAKPRHPHQRDSLLVDTAETYCTAVRTLADVLDRADVASRALRSLRAFLAGYVRSEPFDELTEGVRRVRESLASVHYCMTVGAGKVTVTRYAGEADYGAEVLAAFEKFKQEEATSSRVSAPDFLDMNHIEEAVLDRVAMLFPDVFRTLEDFCTRHHDPLDPTVAAFDREVQFYLAYLELADRLRAAGLPLCFPEVSTTSKAVAGRDVFDLALAVKLVDDGTPVVTNDFELRGPERVLVVSGPNQGGKTTFARTVGQLHQLAALGCPVPGGEARLFLCDEVFTHFERGENLADLSGKLKDDLVRVRAILERATPAGLVIMNEVFTSTTLDDALLLGTRVLRKIIERDLLCVCVTFVDELSRLGPATVSMTSTVVPGDPAVRTYRIVRRPADGLSHALAIAEKYRLTYERLTDRITVRTAGRTTS